MVDVRFELTTSNSSPLDDAICFKALVRWATGKRLPNRLPKLSLVTLDHYGHVQSRRRASARRVEADLNASIQV